MKRGPRSPLSFAAAKVCFRSAARFHSEPRKHIPRARARQRGTTMLESAVMISVLLVMMFGVVGFGNALYTYHFVSNTAREATRWASVRGYTCTGGLSGGCPANDADVNAYVQNLSTGIGLDPTKVTTTTTWVAPPNNLAACATHPNSPGCVVKVQVQYSFQFLFPLLPSGFTMQSTSQMVISQ
jgi:Flp pilus assembly protein TadG